MTAPPFGTLVRPNAKRRGATGSRQQLDVVSGVEQRREILWFRLHWIPVALKNRSRSFYNKVLRRVMHYQDRKVTEDVKAIRAVLSQLQVPERLRRPTLKWELTMVVYRPLGKTERKSGIENRRRGDLVSAHELVCDALEGLWYEDDSQVNRLTLIEDRSAAAPGMLIEGAPR